MSPVDHIPEPVSLIHGPSDIERLLLKVRKASERGVLETLQRAWERAGSNRVRDQLAQAAHILCTTRPDQVPGWVPDFLLATDLAIFDRDGKVWRPSLHLKRWAAVHAAHWRGGRRVMSFPKAYNAAKARLKNEHEAAQPSTMKKSYVIIAHMGRKKIP